MQIVAGVDFTVLLDSPAQATSQIQVARLGEFNDARYGDFAITADDVQAWKDNLSVLPGGKALIDLDHLSDKPSPHRRTEAAGWITDIDLVDGVPMASVEWTPVGESAISEKRYQFFSPAFGEFRNDEGRHQNVLTGGALTNKPFLSMATVQLASDDRLKRALLEQASDPELVQLLEGLVLDVSQAERDKAKSAGNSLPDGSYPINNAKQLHSAAVLAASHHGDWKAAQALIKRRAKEMGVDLSHLPGFGSDSRRTMEQVLTTLELDPETPEEDVVTAIKELQARPSETKTLEEQAKDEGKELVALGTAGEKASVEERIKTLEGIVTNVTKERDEQAFENAFADAQRKGKAVPAEKETLAHIFSLDREAALKLLDREPLVNVKPRGKNHQDFPDAAPDGVEPASFQLDQQVRKHMAEHNMRSDQYIEALNAVQGSSI